VDVIDKVAPTSIPVLLLGETGTGKEMAARILHDRSPRADQPFISVSCAALSETLIEGELFGHERRLGRIQQAIGGTLFLDEIAELPPAIQARLLHALEAADVRLIAATNQDLEANMANGTFRRDLFFRLNVVTITLPPLRERGDDIPILVEHFLRRAQEQMGKTGIRLNEYADSDVLRYPWPGNVRELENLCTRLVALAPSGAILGPEHLNLLPNEQPATAPLPSTDLRDILDFCEREIVRRMLDRHGGNRTRTAKALGISRQALQQKLARFRAQGARNATRNANGADDDEVGSAAS
jgi:two-component system response regulator HydG